MNRRAFWVLSLLGAACGTKTPPKGPLKQYAIEGDVLKVNPADQTATIRHKDIEGWMHAMTMDYPIRTKEDFAKLHPGDHIKGTVFVQDEDYSVGSIQVQ